MIAPSVRETTIKDILITLRWRHNEHDGISNHQPHDCLLNRLFRRRSKKTSKLRVTGLCEGNSPVTGEFPSQRASDAENVSIWWRHHDESVFTWRWGMMNCMLDRDILINWYHACYWVLNRYFHFCHNRAWSGDSFSEVSSFDPCSCIAL